MFRAHFNVVLLAILHSSLATTLPQQTTFPNATTSSPGTAAVTDCPLQCTRDDGLLSSITWSAAQITTTITAETLVYIVNSRTNSTRTTTITNTELDLSNYTALTDVNSAGTRTTSVKITGGGTVRTYALTFPTMLFSDYPSSYTFCGTVPTTTKGAASCLRHPCVRGAYAASVFGSDPLVSAYPSHPPIPLSVQNIPEFAQDPRGSTYEPVWTDDAGYLQELETLFPDLGVTNCSGDVEFSAPDVFKSTALYLTATSTSMEPDEDAATSSPTKPEAEAEASGPQLVPVKASSSPEVVASPAAPAHPAKDTSTSVGEPVSNAPAPNPKELGPPSAQLASPAIAPSNNVVVGAGAAIASVFIVIPSTDNKGSVTAITTQVPAVVLSSTNALGSSVVTTSPIQQQSLATKSVAIVVSSTNSKGNLIAVTSQVPGIVLTTTNAQGSPVVTTSPIKNPTPNTPAAPIIINGQTISSNSKSQLLISGQTLTPGSTITLGSGSATTLAVLQTSNGHTILVVGSSTSTLAPAISTPPSFTIGSQTVTANAKGQFIVGGQTLTSGGVITASGTVISLPTSGSQVVVGTSTEGLGGHIMSGLGGVNATGVVPFTGAAERKGKGLWGAVGAVLGIMGLAVWL